MKKYLVYILSNKYNKYKNILLLLILLRIMVIINSKMSLNNKKIRYKKILL
jgi:hypothetical protein